MYKKSSNATRSNGMVIAVEMKPGEGLGLSNAMVNYAFDSVVAATTYVRQRFGIGANDQLKELHEMPFLMGFRSAALYVDPRLNEFFPRGHFPRCEGRGPLNAMAIYLGCQVNSRLSPFINASGVAFFIGTIAAGDAVTSNVLWGASNLVAQTMNYYPADYTEEERAERFAEWSHKCTSRTFEPVAGTGGVNLFQTDPLSCDWRTEDHRN